MVDEVRAAGEEDASASASPSSPSRWRPNVVALSLAPAATEALPPQREDVEPWVAEYLQAEHTPVNFRVELPVSEEYTPRYTFHLNHGTGGAGGAQRAGGRTGMTSWQAAKGSKVGKDMGLPEFAMPDGKVVRLYKTTEQRNARSPRDEPPEPMPDSIDALGVEMPPPPPPPQCNKRDIPQCALYVHMQFPLPKAHTLKQTSTDAWFGTIADEPLLLGTRKVVEAESSAEPNAPPSDEFDLDQSVFAPRRATSDARSFWNGPKVTRRALEIDFARSCSQAFRTHLIKDLNKDLDGGEVEEGEDEPVLEELKKVLLEHRHALYAVYGYYCINGSSHDRYVMGGNEYAAFVSDCALDDKFSEFCRKRDLDLVFVLADAEERGNDISEEQRAKNAANVDRALMRFEFVQAVVRIAIAKHVKSGATQSVAKATERLITESILPRVPREALHDSDVFRRSRLYTREVHEVFAVHNASLSALYEAFANANKSNNVRDTQAETRAKDKVMDLGEWDMLLNMAQLIDDDFTRRQAALCFVWSQAFCTDDMKRRIVLTHLSYVDFLEALARITTFRPLPTQALLKSTGSRSPEHFYMLATAGLHKGKQQLRKVAWYEEEESTATLAEPLRILLELIVERFDTAGAGVLTVKEIQKRL